MKSLPKFWPVVAALLGVVLFLMGQIYSSGRITGLAFLLFALMLTAMHNRHWLPEKFRGQAAGFFLVLTGLLMTTLGYWQMSMAPEDAEVAERLVLAWISPGQFVLVPLGLILFGVYIQHAQTIPNWGKPVVLVVGIVGFVGILPTIINWFGYREFMILAELSGLVVILGWLLIGIVLWREAIFISEN